MNDSDKIAANLSARRSTEEREAKLQNRQTDVKSATWSRHGALSELLWFVGESDDEQVGGKRDEGGGGGRGGQGPIPRFDQGTPPYLLTSIQDRYGSAQLWQPIAIYSSTLTSS